MSITVKANLVIGFMLALAIIPFAGNTQNSFDFGYDAAGNRTSRTISLKSAEINNETATSQLEKPFEDNIGFGTTRIYPNPTKGILHVEIVSGMEQLAALTVHDLNGKLVVEKKSITFNCDINLSPFPAGTYILRIFIGQDNKEWKVIKE